MPGGTSCVCACTCPNSCPAATGSVRDDRVHGRLHSCNRTFPQEQAQQAQARNAGTGSQRRHRLATQAQARQIAGTKQTTTEGAWPALPTCLVCRPLEC